MPYIFKGGRCQSGDGLLGLGEIGHWKRIDKTMRLSRGGHWAHRKKKGMSPQQSTKEGTPE